MWHPAALLLSWVGFALILQSVSLDVLILLVLVCLLLVSAFALARGWRLLRRSRWLLISVGILFLFFTPGEYLPGLAGRVGVTHEGVTHALEQLGRLVAILASLAFLHERIGTAGLLCGLHWLMRPFPWCNATVVRLMLVLELIEDRRELRWREWLNEEIKAEPQGNNLELVMPPWRWRDGALLSAWGLAGIFWIVR